MKTRIHLVNLLPNGKILDLSKFKRSADDTLMLVKMVIFISYMIENVVVKGENAGYQHFLLFQKRFRKASFSGSLKNGIVW